MNNLGIDIGRVIIGPTIDGPADTAFIGTTIDEAMTSPPAPGAFEAIAELVARFDGRVWLVSKCGPSVQRKTRLWLDHWGFHDATGVPRDHVRFCLERHEKRLHTDELGITHFIDDRVDVLRHLRGGVEHLFLFGEQPNAAPAWAIPVQTWAEVSAWFATRSSCR